MREMWVRGVFFRQVLNFVKKDRSQTSYDLLERKIEDYRDEEKYDFRDFGELLSKIKMITSSQDDYIARIARETMAEEATWKHLFRRMDPTNVFASDQRQRVRQHIADYESLVVENGHIELRMEMWTDNRDHQDLWAEFYRGRLEGILELMGRKGAIKLTKEFGDGGIFTYSITWT